MQALPAQACCPGLLAAAAADSPWAVCLFWWLHVFAAVFLPVSSLRFSARILLQRCSLIMPCAGGAPDMISFGDSPSHRAAGAATAATAAGDGHHPEALVDQMGNLGLRGDSRDDSAERQHQQYS